MNKLTIFLVYTSGLLLGFGLGLYIGTDLGAWDMIELATEMGGVSLILGFSLFVFSGVYEARKKKEGSEITTVKKVQH